MGPCAMWTLRNTTLLLRRSISEVCASSAMACCGTAATAGASPGRTCSTTVTSSSTRGSLRVEAAIDLLFQVHGTIFQICDHTPRSQGVRAEIDAHIALGGGRRLDDI